MKNSFEILTHVAHLLSRLLSSLNTKSIFSLHISFIPPFFYAFFMKLCTYNLNYEIVCELDEKAHFFDTFKMNDIVFFCKNLEYMFLRCILLQTYIIIFLLRSTLHKVVKEQRT